MSTEPYPGANATPDELLRHADAFRNGAERLLAGCGSVVRAPAQACALQALELYLTAFLRGHGSPAASHRDHDLERRAAAARDCGLVLRARTREHLLQMTEQREFLIARYGADIAFDFGPPNRTVATLTEVAEKVRRLLARTAIAPSSPASRAA